MAGTARLSRPGRPRGFALLAMLVVVAAMGAAIAVTGTIWHHVQRRAMENELIFVGLQYRKAIADYYNATPAHQYPPSIDALLRDDRMPSLVRHLRRPYRDPLTNSTTWGTVLAPGGGIMGIFSLGKGRPIKQANFPAELNWPGGPASYADWQFMYIPTR
ncbi:MAG TPA: type II secretion system protein [Rhodocyclaceae bacterium]